MLALFLPPTLLAWRLPPELPAQQPAGVVVEVSGDISWGAEARSHPRNHPYSDDRLDSPFDELALAPETSRRRLGTVLDCGGTLCYSCNSNNCDHGCDDCVQTAWCCCGSCDYYCECDKGCYRYM